MIVLRYFTIFIIIGLAVGAFLWFSGSRYKRESSKPIDPRIRADHMGGEAVRQLDLILNDPLLVGDDHWRFYSQEIVNRWHLRDQKTWDSTSSQKTSINKERQ